MPRPTLEVADIFRSHGLVWRKANRPCSRLPPIRSILAPGSASPRSCIPGGSALTHHPHVHMIVPGGGVSLDGERFVPCRGRRRRFFLPVRVLSRVFRRLVLEKLAAAYDKGLLSFKGSLAKFAAPAAFAAALRPLRWKKWFVYIKEPFAGPKAVL